MSALTVSIERNGSMIPVGRLDGGHSAHNHQQFFHKSLENLVAIPCNRKTRLISQPLFPGRLIYLPYPCGLPFTFNNCLFSRGSC